MSAYIVVNEFYRSGSAVPEIYFSQKWSLLFQVGFIPLLYDQAFIFLGSDWFKVVIQC